MLLFRFSLQQFRLGNRHNGTENALEIAELIFRVTLRYQFRLGLRDWLVFGFHLCDCFGHQRGDGGRQREFS